MTSFELPLTEGKPLEIVDFKLDLLLSPPEIRDRIIDSVDEYISTQPEKIKINYSDAPVEEGRLNIYICRFKSGKYRLHIFGKIKGAEFRAEREITDTRNKSLALLNMKIRYVLLNSRNILRTYYLKSNIKSIENHLMAFLLPL
jgi:hypothetical protein